MKTIIFLFVLVKFFASDVILGMEEKSEPINEQKQLTKYLFKCVKKGCFRELYGAITALQLINKEFNINSFQNKQGNLLLHEAIKDSVVILILLRAGANVTLSNRLGRTAYQLARRARIDDAIRLGLLEQGRDCNYYEILIIPLYELPHFFTAEDSQGGYREDFQATPRQLFNDHDQDTPEANDSSEARFKREMRGLAMVSAQEKFRKEMNDDLAEFFTAISSESQHDQATRMIVVLLDAMKARHFDIGTFLWTNNQTLERHCILYHLIKAYLEREKIIARGHDILKEMLLPTAIVVPLFAFLLIMGVSDDSNCIQNMVFGGLGSGIFALVIMLWGRYMVLRFLPLASCEQSTIEEMINTVMVAMVETGSIMDEETEKLFEQNPPTNRLTSILIPCVKFIKK